MQTPYSTFFFFLKETMTPVSGLFRVLQLLQLSYPKYLYCGFSGFPSTSGSRLVPNPLSVVVFCEHFDSGFFVQTSLICFLSFQDFLMCLNTLVVLFCCFLGGSKYVGSERDSNFYLVNCLDLKLL